MRYTNLVGDGVWGYYLLGHRESKFTFENRSILMDLKVLFFFRALFLMICRTQFLYQTTIIENTIPKDIKKKKIK